MAPMVSVVIPAHNEERVIERCLRALPLSDVEVVVVCNGCTDATAEVASRVSSSIRVECIEEASKTAALNHGDRVAQSFPRVYLDADTVLEHDAIITLADALRGGPALAAGVRVDYDLAQSSRWVRSYYAIWSRLPSVGDDIVGGGVYALSADGRRRFDQFPALLGDDHFVRDSFTPEERVVTDARSVVTAERNVRALLRRKVRVFTGNRLVYTAQPGGRTRGVRRQAQWIQVVRERPRLAVHVSTFLAITLAAKLSSRWRTMRGTHVDWGRNDAARAPAQ